MRAPVRYVVCFRAAPPTGPSIESQWGGMADSFLKSATTASGHCYSSIVPWRAMVFDDYADQWVQ